MTPNPHTRVPCRKLSRVSTTRLCRAPNHLRRPTQEASRAGEPGTVFIPMSDRFDTVLRHFNQPNKPCSTESCCVRGFRYPVLAQTFSETTKPKAWREIPSRRFIGSCGPPMPWACLTSTLLAKSAAGHGLFCSRHSEMQFQPKLQFSRWHNGRSNYTSGPRTVRDEMQVY
jgi:hypothetical protein